MNPQDPRAQAPGTAPDRPADRGVTGPDTSTLTVVDPAQAASLRVVGVGGEESLEYTPEERRHVRRRSWALLRQLAQPRPRGSPSSDRHERYRMLVRSAPTTAHARRSLIS